MWYVLKRINSYITPNYLYGEICITLPADEVEEGDLYGTVRLVLSKVMKMGNVFRLEIGGFYKSKHMAFEFYEFMAQQARSMWLWNTCTDVRSDVFINKFSDGAVVSGKEYASIDDLEWCEKFYKIYLSVIGKHLGHTKSVKTS